MASKDVKISRKNQIRLANLFDKLEILLSKEPEKLAEVRKIRDDLFKIIKELYPEAR
jgi:hypothetical protein